MFVAFAFDPPLHFHRILIFYCPLNIKMAERESAIKAILTTALLEMRAALEEERARAAEERARASAERLLLHSALEELRELLPERIAAREERRKEKRRRNFLSCLILAAHNGFGQDVEPFLALSRETWGAEQLWAAAKDLPHGRARREGPARQHAAEPFGFERPALRTRLMCAAQAGDVARLRWLIAQGARLELKDWKGRTALLWACREGRVEAVRELLTRGAAVGAAANFGATPLHIASESGHLEVVRELLAHGASPGAAANNGATALSRATAKCHGAIAQLLRAALAKTHG